MRTYRVKGTSLSAISHGGDVFPVVDGLVELPEGAAFYADLVKAGTLVPAESLGGAALPGEGGEEAGALGEDEGEGEAAEGEEAPKARKQSGRGRGKAG